MAAPSDQEANIATIVSARLGSVTATTSPALDPVGGQTGGNITNRLSEPGVVQLNPRIAQAAGVRIGSCLQFGYRSAIHGRLRRSGR